MEKSRQLLIPLLNAFEINCRKSAQNNTALFRLLIDDYTKYGSDFRSSNDGKPYRELFKSLDYYGTLPMDTIEDLKTIHELYKTLGVSKDGSNEMHFGCCYQGLFYRPGWAKGNNNWFLEALKYMKTFTARLPDIRLEPLPVEEECQFVFMENVLKDLKFSFNFNPQMLAAMKREQRLWTTLEESVLSPNATDSKGHNIVFASDVLDGKPIVRVYEEEYKNVMSRSFRGDHSLLKPLIDCYFESVVGVWPKEWIKAMRKFCTISLSGRGQKYSKEIKKLVMESPSKSFTKYINNCKEFADDVGEHALTHLDYDSVSWHTIYRMTHWKGEVEDDFLHDAPVSAVRRFILGFPELEMSRFLHNIQDDERVSELLATGEFADAFFYNRFADEEPRGFPVYTFYRDNVDRLQRLLPSGHLSTPHAIISLVLDKRIPDHLRACILKNLRLDEPSDRDEENCWRVRLGLKDDLTSSLAEAVKGIKLESLLDDRALVETISYYLVQKIKAQKDSPDDVCEIVILALTLTAADYVGR